MGIVAMKIVRNGSPPQQRGFTDIVKRISKDNVDLAVSNVSRGSRRCQLVVLHGQVETATESDVMLRSMHRRLRGARMFGSHETHMSEREHRDKE